MIEVLTDIPFHLSLDGFQKKSQLRRVTAEIEKDINDLITLIHAVAKPKVVYRVSYVSRKNGDSLEVDGVKLTSRVLRMNLDEVGRVFPYVATCGTEVDQIAVPSGDMMKAYYLDTLKEMVLESALSYLEDYLTERYALGQISEMEPGSLDTWPITQQKELFSIIGDVERLVGVRLTDRFLMIPLKSVSGIYFPTEIKFESCQLCQRERCPQRRAPFNSDVAEKYT
jgi:hypothetical protein